MPRLHRRQAIEVLPVCVNAASVLLVVEVQVAPAVAAIAAALACAVAAIAVSAARAFVPLAAFWLHPRSALPIADVPCPAAAEVSDVPVAASRSTFPAAVGIFDLFLDRPYWELPDVPKQAGRLGGRDWGDPRLLRFELAQRRRREVLRASELLPLQAHHDSWRSAVAGPFEPPQCAPFGRLHVEYGSRAHKPPPEQ